MEDKEDCTCYICGQKRHVKELREEANAIIREAKTISRYLIKKPPYIS